MSKMKELSTVLDELLETATALTTIAEKLVTATKAVKDIFSSDEAPAAPTEDAKTYTKEEVRKILAGVSAGGHKEEVKALIAKYGADTLTNLDPAHYAAIVADAETLNHE